MSTAETLINDLRLENFFVGDFLSNGIIVKPNGKLIRRFKVEGQSNFKKGTLTSTKNLLMTTAKLIACMANLMFAGWVIRRLYNRSCWPPPRNHPTENLLAGLIA